MKQSSVLDKVIGVISPLIIYFFVALFVQVGFTGIVMVTNFKGLGNDGVKYTDSANFMENMNSVINNNTLLITLITIIICIPIFLYMFKKLRGNLAFTGKKKGLYINIIIGIFASLGVSKLVTIFPIDGILGNYSETAKNVMSQNLPLQIIALVILGPLMEELLFRGLIYNKLKIISETTIAAYISAIIFGVYHMNLVQGLYTFVLGVLLAYVYEKYNTIIAAYLLHMAANATAVIINYLPISKAINNHWYFKAPVMIMEIAVLVLVIYKMLYKKKASN